MILGMSPFTRKIHQRGVKKPPPDNPSDVKKHPATSNFSKYLTPLSMNELFHQFSNALDAHFYQHTKNLSKDVDSKAHGRVDTTFQLLKEEHDSKLNNSTSVTNSKVIESANNVIHHL